MQAQTSPREPARAGGRATVVPLAEPVGAEIRFVDVGAGVDDGTFGFIRNALHEHSVIVLRGQDITPDQQKQFALRLGEMRTSFYNRYGVPGHPELSVVSNIMKDGEAIGIADAGMLWHTDGSYLQTPDMYTVLYGVEIPQRDGKALGDTAFSSSWRAYEALPADMKARLQGMRATHSFAAHIEKKRSKGQLKRAPLSAEQKAALPDVDHPIVRRHPFNGRPCLFVTEGHTSAIVGLPPQESDALLGFLTEHVKQPQFQYRHSWRAGDLVVWDNCAVQHLAIFDYGDIPRRLHRAGIHGPVPV
jgi:taurine dioxygenase